MASKTSSTEITRQKKVIVKSEEALKEMQDNRQLESFTDYYTPEEDEPVLTLPIGSIFSSAIPQNDARVHLLDGSLISQTGAYSDFANLINELVADGKLTVYTTQSQFDNDISTYGQCGKFVIDDPVGTIRLPLITEFIASNNGGQEIGLAQLDMFKSHCHSLGAICTGGQAGTHFMQVSNGVGTSWDGTAAGYKRYSDDTGGEETRPKNIRYPYYIVLANGYKSKEVVNFDNIMNDVNLKANAVETSQLVAEITAVGGETNIVFNNLDIASDGGIYDFEISSPSTSPNIRMKAGNDGGFASFGISGNWNGATAYNTSQRAAGGVLVANVYNGCMLVTGTIKQHSNNKASVIAISESGNTSGASDVRCLVTCGYFNLSSNITSITFSAEAGSYSGTTFVAGQKIRIYKRATNIPTRSLL